MSLVKFKSKNHPQQVRHTGAKDAIDDRETDPALFAKLERRFGGFSIDVAAAAHNAKCERYYDRQANGLNQSWAGERVWCNPPYSSIEPWVVKANEEAADAELIVMLLPANRTEQGWWQKHVEPRRDGADGLRVEFLAGRIRFIKQGATRIGPNERPPFGCCLLIWRRAEDLAGREGGQVTNPPGDTTQLPSTNAATDMVGFR